MTGGTDGIGLGYCEELAKLGFNICIISRSQEKLERVREDIRSLNPEIDVKIIKADFGRSLEDGFFEPICRELDQIDVSVLVNNVGTFNHCNYVDLKEDELKHELTLNIIPISLLSRYMIPRMLQRNTRSGIINLSSSSVLFEFVGGAGYCSTKLFDDFLSKTLAD